MNDDDGVLEPAASRPDRARNRILVGAAALAVILGGGAYLVTSSLTDDRSATTDHGALTRLAPVDSEPAPSSGPPAASVSPSPTSAPASSPTPTQSPSYSPSPSPSHESSAAVRKDVDRARAQAAKDGIALQRPLPQKGMQAAADAVTTTEKTAEGTIRITTAHGDLTGQQDQLLAADNGKPVGDAHCTQKIRFSDGAPARVIPSLLLCWRTSADRSVVTIAVASKGQPSGANSVAVIDREWAKLG